MIILSATVRNSIDLLAQDAKFTLGFLSDARGFNGKDEILALFTDGLYIYIDYSH